MKAYVPSLLLGAWAGARGLGYDFTVFWLTALFVAVVFSALGLRERYRGR